MRTRVEIKNDAKIQLDGKRGTAALITLLLMLVSFIPNICTKFIEPGAVLMLINVGIEIYITLLSIGCIIFYYAVMRGEEVSVEMLFSGYQYYLKGFFIYLLYGLAIFIGTVLLIIPGIIFALMYSQAVYIYIENPEMGVIECMKTSRLAMDGHKTDLLVLNLSFIGWVLLCAITCGILTLYVAPYAGVAQINFHADLMKEYMRRQ